MSIERQFCDILVICECPAIDDMMVLLYFGKQFCDRAVLIITLLFAGRQFCVLLEQSRRISLLEAIRAHSFLFIGNCFAFLCSIHC